MRRLLLCSVALFSLLVLPTAEAGDCQGQCNSNNFSTFGSGQILTFQSYSAPAVFTVQSAQVYGLEPIGFAPYGVTKTRTKMKTRGFARGGFFSRSNGGCP